MRSQLHKSAWPFREQAGDRFKLAFHQAEQWLLERADKSQHCRECGNRVQLFEDICPHCGAASPSRIPCSLGALAAAAALACLALAAILI